MAAKKNVEEVKVTEEVIEEPEVEVVEEPVTEEATAKEAEKEPEATEEKKENFIKRWASAQKKEWKEHPVKKAGKTLGQVTIGVLAVIGGKRVFDAVTDNSEVVETVVPALVDKVEDVAETTIEEF